VTAGVFALALALWLASTLGLVHRTVHFGGAHPAASVGAVQAQPHAHGIGAFFGLHTDAECRLYDQLSHGFAAPSVALVVLPLLLPTASFAWLEGVAAARWIAHFDARGPPLSR